VEILKASHLAMIRAVGALGGMAMWLRFFETHPDLREELKKMSVLAQAEVAEISQLGKRKPSGCTSVKEA
jgi:hypothetical protein